MQLQSPLLFATQILNAGLNWLLFAAFCAILHQRLRTGLRIRRIILSEDRSWEFRSLGHRFWRIDTGFVSGGLRELAGVEGDLVLGFYDWLRLYQLRFPSATLFLVLPWELTLLEVFFELFEDGFFLRKRRKILFALLVGFKIRGSVSGQHR